MFLLAGYGSWGQPPTITSFSPASGPVGTTVTLTGTNFTASDIVYLGGVRATLGVTTSIQMAVTVPAGAVFGPISVTNQSTGLTGYSGKPFLVTFPGGSPVSSASLGTAVNFSTGGDPAKTAMADFDGDAKLDVAVANYSSNRITVFRNTSTQGSINPSSFSAGVDFITPGSAYPIAAGDMDGDGMIDLVTANGGGANSLSVFRNTASVGVINSGSFSAPVDFATGGNPQAVCIGDVDGDGRPELIVSNYNDNTISVYRNQSTQGTISLSSFAARVDFITSSGPMNMAFADVDQDAKKDLLVVCQGSNTVSVFRNTSSSGAINSGTFATRVDFATALGPEGISIGDLDGDARDDVVVTNFNSNSVSVLRNTHTAGPVAAGTFAGKVDFSTGGFQSQVKVADIDGDGKLDLVVDNGSANISVLRNTVSAGVINSSSFATKVDFAVGSSPSDIEIGDIDGDGKPEVVVVNNGGAGISVLRNNVLAPEPTAQPPGPITFFNVISTAFRASWMETNPVPDGYLAVISANTSPTFVPVDGVPYTYYQMVGVASGNNMYVVQNSSEPGINLSNLITGEAINVKVYAFNGSGPTINYLTTSPLEGAQTPTPDTDKPREILNSTSSTVTPGTNLLFKGNFTDDTSGVDYVEVEYRPITASASTGFQLLEMLPTTGSSYEVSLPAAEVGELGIEYRFLATDFEGNNNVTDQQTYRTRVRFESGLYIPYPNEGRTVQNYRIIAVPLILDDKSLNTVLGSTLGPYDPTIWAAYRWTGTRLDELNNDSQVIIGQGYWFITTTNVGDGMLSGAGTTPDVSPSDPFTITLVPGWNQIGNPYNFNISWSDILQANPTLLASLGGANSKIRVFRGVVENVDELVTFEGGFVKNTGASNITINIPVEKNLSINSRKATTGPLQNALDQPSWEILFSLSQGETTYNLGGLGMRPDAEVDFDYYDDFNLPRFFDYLEVKFPKQRVGMTYTKDIVPTSGNFVWEFSVDSNIDESPISMRWDNTYFGTGKEIYLVDMAEHRAVNMNEVSKYSFAPSPSRPFKVVYGDVEFVKNEILPGQAVLFAPYPNPFNERVTFGYSLPKEAVTQGAAMDIYTGQGTRVSTVDLPAVPGEGNWEWVSEQAPGMYFVRLRMGDQMVVKKIIKR